MAVSATRPSRSGIGPRSTGRARSDGGSREFAGMGRKVSFRPMKSRHFSARMSAGRSARRQPAPAISRPSIGTRCRRHRLTSRRSSRFRASPTASCGILVERLIVDRAALARRYSDDQAAERRAALREFTRAWRAQRGADSLRAARPGRPRSTTSSFEPFDYQSSSSTGRIGAAEGNGGAAFRSARRSARCTSRGGAWRMSIRARRPPRSRRWRTTSTTGGRSSSRATRKRRRCRGSSRCAPRTRAGDLKRLLEQWFKFHDGYSPLFSWWVRDPYKSVDGAMTAYVKVLRERIVGYKEGEDEPIVGDPIGREGHPRGPRRRDDSSTRPRSSSRSPRRSTRGARRR